MSTIRTGIGKKKCRNGVFFEDRLATVTAIHQNAPRPQADNRSRWARQEVLTYYLTETQESSNLTCMISPCSPFVECCAEFGPSLTLECPEGQPRGPGRYQGKGSGSGSGR